MLHLNLSNPQTKCFVSFYRLLCSGIQSNVLSKQVQSSALYISCCDHTGNIEDNYMEKKNHTFSRIFLV